jgi:predicted transcriptional regulator
VDPRTQELISLLGREVTRALLATLRGAPATEKELTAATGASQPVVNRTLNDLAGFRLVRRTKPVVTGKRGRPRSAWQIASRQRLERLEAGLDRCTARLR